jgi:hypothetical protein
VAQVAAQHVANHGQRQGGVRGPPRWERLAGAALPTHALRLGGDSRGPYVESLRFFGFEAISNGVYILKKDRAGRNGMVRYRYPQQIPIYRWYVLSIVKHLYSVEISLTPWSENNKRDYFRKKQ